MLDGVRGADATGDLASGRLEQDRSLGDRINDALSWASPDGLILHALQPILADGLRRSGVGRGTEWGPSLQRVLDSPHAIGSFQGGFREGLFNGAKSLVEGAIDLVKLGINLGPAGLAGDALRHLGVKLPDWAPSSEAASAKLQAAGSAVGQYLAGVAHNPAKLGDDIKGWIGANWNSLKADHAKAAAQGPDAEAKWWGQIAGRATFEIAAVVVPATKFATVAKAGEALEIALRAGKLGQTFAEAARVGKLGELWGAAVKAGKVAEVVAEARTAGRLTELVAEARKTTGGIEALAKKGALSFEEVSALQKGGTLTAAEAQVADHAITAREIARLTAAEGGISRTIAIPAKPLQSKFKHAIDFGVQGNYSPKNGAAFGKAVEAHVAKPGVIAVNGTYRGNPVTHFLDPATKLNVIRDANGNFLSGWKLSDAQFKNVLGSGNLGGG